MLYFLCVIEKQNLNNMSLQKKIHLETDNSVSIPSRNRIPDRLETDFSVLKTLVCDFDHL